MKRVCISVKDNLVAQKTFVDHINNELKLLPPNNYHFHTNECFGTFDVVQSIYPLVCGKESGG